MDCCDQHAVATPYALFTFPADARLRTSTFGSATALASVDTGLDHISVYLRDTQAAAVKASSYSMWV